MTFPPLADWQTTSLALHQAAMLIGPIHNALLPSRNNYLHLPLWVEPDGLSSQRLPQGGQLFVRFKDPAVIYRRLTQADVVFPLHEHTQRSLFEALLKELYQDELSHFCAGMPTDALTNGMMTKLHANPARIEFLHLPDVTHTEPLTVNRQTASDYADVLYGVYTGVARFRARLEGPMTPIVVWAEHFDLSTLWFHPENSAMDDTKPHINIGFAPYSTGQYEQPYLYFYAYPYPPDFTPPQLPAPAFWHTEGWQGVVVNYADIQQQADPIAFVERMCAEVYPLLTGLLGS
ncbi:MAG: DUF5996 family protein [Phototrophicaceae bacterium]